MTALRRSVVPAVCGLWSQLQAQLAKGVDVRLLQLQRQQLQPEEAEAETLEDFGHRCNARRTRPCARRSRASVRRSRRRST